LQPSLKAVPALVASIAHVSPIVSPIATRPRRELRPLKALCGAFLQEAKREAPLNFAAARTASILIVRLPTISNNAGFAKWCHVAKDRNTRKTFSIAVGW
jgi:hypothetical protein